MNYDSQKHHRKSIRLKDYDYAQEGWYFITIIVQNRECLFGKINNGKVELNQIGSIIQYHWKKIVQHFPHIELDEYIVMPNHIHGIVHIVRVMHSEHNNKKVYKELDMNASPLQSWPAGTKPGSLSAIMQNYKAVTSRKINRIRKIQGMRLWQRNFWEHIIRNEDTLNRIREYIKQNPAEWIEDKLYV